jgi:hypothetical protein
MVQIPRLCSSLKITGILLHHVHPSAMPHFSLYFCCALGSFLSATKSCLFLLDAVFFELLSHLFHWLPLVGQWSHGFLSCLKTKESHQPTSRRPSFDTRVHLAFKHVAFCSHLLKEQHNSFTSNFVSQQPSIDSSASCSTTSASCFDHVVSLPPFCSPTSHLPAGFRPRGFLSLNHVIKISRLRRFGGSHLV